MVGSYTLGYLAAGLAVVFACIALPVIGAKLLRKFMDEDAAAESISE